jgi:hypothetical protein
LSDVAKTGPAMNRDEAANKRPPDERNDQVEMAMLDMSEPPAPPDLDNFQRRAGEIIAKAAAGRHKGNRSDE